MKIESVSADILRVRSDPDRDVLVVSAVVDDLGVKRGLVRSVYVDEFLDPEKTHIKTL